MNKINIPEAIRNAPLPPSVQTRYDDTHAWLSRLSVIAGQHKRHPWCTDMAFIVHMHLKESALQHECYIQSSELHSVCVYKGIIIDINENLYISDFDWRTQTIPQSYVKIVPDRADRLDPASRMHLYYGVCATSAFRLVGQTLHTQPQYS
jgi:hypothetical protein